MTEDDRGTFIAAFVRVCACQGRPFDPDQGAAYFESPLRKYPIETVLEAMDAALLKCGRYIPEVGLITEVIEELRVAGRGQAATSGTRQNCDRCDGTGWAPAIDGRDAASWGDIKDTMRPGLSTLKHRGVVRCGCRQAVAS